MPTASVSGLPRLPPTNVGRPVARIISPTSVVVVDLPLVPVIAISVRDDEPRRQLDLAGDRDAGGARGRQLGDLGHAGRQHDQVGAREGLALVAAELARRRPRGSAASAGASAPRRALVGDGHARAARRAELRRRDPGAPETDDEHAFAVQLQVEALIAPSAWR